MSLGEDAGGTRRIKAITTRYCLKLLNFCKVSSPRTETHRATTCNNIFLPRHPQNDAFLRFTHLASPSCFQATAGISLQSSNLRSFRFQDKRSSQRQSHVTTQNVPPALRIWPRKQGARRPHLRPCLNRSTFKTGRSHCF